MSVYLITGVSGYIGSMLTKYLLEREPDSEVLALVRDLRKIQDCFFSDSAEKLKRISFFQADLCDAELTERFWREREKLCMDYVIHCASVTSSSEMTEHPVEVTESIVNGTQNVLELVRRCGIKSMVYLSSMEVYGSVDFAGGRRTTEEEAGGGNVELLNARSCYPLGKRMAENICYNYWKEYGVPVKIARLAQTFGSGVLPSDNRVFAQFARSVKSGSDIILHTEGRSMGNYCAIDDTVSGILAILKRGRNGEAYNVVNEKNTMTIRQMAELAASLDPEGKVRVRFERLPGGRHSYAADTGLRLSGEKLKSLGWQPKKSLQDMYREILADMEV